MYLLKERRSEKALSWSNCFLAVTVLLLAGVVYRVAASHLKPLTESPIVLPIPLTGLPTEIGGWRGKDVPISQNIQRVAGNDDFLNRLYTNQGNNQWANIYIAYSARPRNMIGHQPQVCYVAGGWVHDNTEMAEVICAGGRKVPCLLHRFHRPAPETEEIVVLNFYVVNGQLTRDENVFTGLGWRTPNIAGDPARYVAQIQISSVLETSVRSAATDMTHLILDFFPDQNGKVRVAVHTDKTSRAVK